MRSEIVLVATTVGIGPFRPAIRYNGLTYASPSTACKSEDRAAEIAVAKLGDVESAIADMLKHWRVW